MMALTSQHCLCLLHSLGLGQRSRLDSRANKHLAERQQRSMRLLLLSADCFYSLYAYKHISAQRQSEVEVSHCGCLNPHSSLFSTNLNPSSSAMVVLILIEHEGLRWPLPLRNP